MNIIKRITFSLYGDDGTHTLEELFFELTKKGLKHVWLEIQSVKLGDQEYKKIVQIYSDDKLKVDFKIRNKKEWFDGGEGVIKIPFKESHLL